MACGTIWNRNTELGLFRAHSKAGGPVVAGTSAFLGRGLMDRSKRLGSRTVGGNGSSWLCRVCESSVVDVHCAQYFVNSPLALVVLFRGRLKSVRRCTLVFWAKWDAPQKCWQTVCRQTPLLAQTTLALATVGHHDHFWPRRFFGRGAEGWRRAKISRIFPSPATTCWSSRAVV